MKIRTVEELEDKLDRDLSWRKKEILSFKLLIDGNETNRKFLLRSAIILLCAHFEGFIKMASNYYVIYITNKNVKYDEIIHTLLAIKLKSKFKQCSETEKYSVHASMLKHIELIKNDKFFLKVSEPSLIISTESNPSSVVLKEILITLGLNSDIFNTKSNYIDYSLLNNRNKIVHGENHEIDYDDFKNVFDIVMKLLDDYKELIVYSAEKQLYLKNRCELVYA